MEFEYKDDDDDTQYFDALIDYEINRELTDDEVKYYRRSAEITKAYDKACNRRTWVIFAGLAVWSPLSSAAMVTFATDASDFEHTIFLMMIASVPVLLVIYGIVSWFYSPLGTYIEKTMDQTEKS